MTPIDFLFFTPIDIYKWLITTNIIHHWIHEHQDIILLFLFSYPRHSWIDDEGLETTLVQIFVLLLANIHTHTFFSRLKKFFHIIWGFGTFFWGRVSIVFRFRFTTLYVHGELFKIFFLLLLFVILNTNVYIKREGRANASKQQQSRWIFSLFLFCSFVCLFEMFDLFWIWISFLSILSGQEKYWAVVCLSISLWVCVLGYEIFFPEKQTTDRYEFENLEIIRIWCLTLFILGWWIFFLFDFYAHSIISNGWMNRFSQHLSLSFSPKLFSFELLSYLSTIWILMVNECSWGFYSLYSGWLKKKCECQNRSFPFFFVVVSLVIPTTIIDVWYSLHEIDLQIIRIIFFRNIILLSEISNLFNNNTESHHHHHDYRIQEMKFFFQNFFHFLFSVFSFEILN